MTEFTVRLTPLNSASKAFQLGYGYPALPRFSSAESEPRADEFKSYRISRERRSNPFFKRAVELFTTVVPFDVAMCWADEMARNEALTLAYQEKFNRAFGLNLDDERLDQLLQTATALFKDDRRQWPQKEIMSWPSRRVLDFLVALEDKGFPVVDILGYQRPQGKTQLNDEDLTLKIGQDIIAVAYERYLNERAIPSASDSQYTPVNRIKRWL